MFSYIFSFVHSGLGFGLIMIGISWLYITFHRSLRSIDQKPLKARFKVMTSFKYILTSFIVTIIFTLTLLLPLHETTNIYSVHIKVILIMTTLFIFLNKYYINKIPNLKLYASVYHWQPPPVLPWQLPTNFDQNSVKLTCVSDNNK